MTQWSDQLYYLQKVRGFPWGLSHIFLLVNVIVGVSAYSETGIRVCV